MPLNGVLANFCSRLLSGLLSSNRSKSNFFYSKVWHFAHFSFLWKFFHNSSHPKTKNTYHKLLAGFRQNPCKTPSPFHNILVRSCCRCHIIICWKEGELPDVCYSCTNVACITSTHQKTKLESLKHGLNNWT